MRLGRGFLIGLPTAVCGLAIATYGGFAASSAGQPTPEQVTLCGVGTATAQHIEGSSNQDHPSPSSFTATQVAYGTQCTAQNSAPGSNSWDILHSNADVVTERGTEHGEFLLQSSSNEAGFDGHITDYDLQPGGDPCVDAAGRSVFYQSGTETDCPTSFGPVGNFNTHGGAQTGQHFRGTYGTIIFQQNSNQHTCDVGTQMYCIEVNLTGQTN
jgi:hypothetical protein